MADDLFSNVRILSPDEVASGVNPFKNEEPPVDPGEDPKPNEDPQDPNPGIRILGPDEVKPSTDPKNDDDPADPPVDDPVDPKPGTSTGGDDVDVNLQKLAEVLSNKGLFELPEDGKVESEDDILELMRGRVDKESQAVFENWKQSLPEKEQAFLGLREAGFETEEAVEVAEYQEFLSGISEESSEEDLVKTYELLLSLKDLPEDEIKDAVENAKDLNKLKEKALRAKTELDKSISQEISNREAATKQAADDAKAAQETKFNKLMGLIDNSKELVPGINLTPKMKEKVKDSMTKAVETVDGKNLNYVSSLQNKNPEGFNVLLHYYAQMGLFNVDKEGNLAPDLSKINTKVKTKQTSSLIDSVTGRKTGDNDDPKPSSFIEKLEKYQKRN